MQPLVSIIIPAYNAAPWLQETLESAFAQTWPAIEVIVVNDGSTDDTLAIAQRYEHRGLRIVSQPNRGLSAARNTGLRMATGDYIQFLDADDLLAADKIEHQVNLLNSAPAGTLATCGWGTFRKDPARAQFNPSPLWRDLDAQGYLAYVARTGNAITVSAWLLPGRLVDVVGPFAEELSVMEDHEYFARAVLASAGIRFCDHGRSYYRFFHAHSLSKHRHHAASKAMLRSVELIESHLLGSSTRSAMRQVAADYYQWLVFKLYPDHPDLIQIAEQRVEALGGSNVKLSMGRRGRALARVIGWKLVQRLRAWLWSKGIYLGKDEFISD